MFWFPVAPLDWAADEARAYSLEMRLKFSRYSRRYLTDSPWFSFRMRSFWSFYETLWLIEFRPLLTRSRLPMRSSRL